MIKIAEYIIKYNGDLSTLGLDVEILNENYAIIFIDTKDVETLYNYTQIEYFEPSKKVFASIKNELEYACILQVKREYSFGLSGKGVVVGIIDSGIDTSHTEFRDADGKTRVLYIWDMTIPRNAPSGFRMGTEYTSNDINLALENNTVISQDVVGHGTAVAGIAVGKTGVADEASIIAVKLGNGNSSRTTDIMRGIKYIIDKSLMLGMPCVINLSYGTNNGSHNGQSLFETYINSMSQKWKTVIVCASGNEGFGGHHFYDKLIQDKNLKVDFALATQSKSVYLTIWKNFSDTVTYELISPSGRSTGIISPQNFSLSMVIDNVKVSVLYSQPSHYSVAQEIYCYFEATKDKIPDGIWSLICRGEKIIDGSFDIWLPTIEEVTENTAFLQPYTDLTMTLPSTSMDVISVGGYRADTDTISTFSGRGEGMCNGKVKLDLVAPAENIYTAKSGGGYDTFTGTSMAAPFVTGSAALMLEWGIVQGNDPFLYGQRVKAFLCRNAERNAYFSYPNSVWGYGTLNLCDTMDNLENYIRR